MNIHEYQAKAILRQYSINVPNGYLVEKEDEITKALNRIETPVAVIKAQVHAGGRGKAGGVKLVKSISEGVEVSKKMLNSQLVTHQTTAQGVKVRKIYIEEGCQIKSEYYLSFVLDRDCSQIMLICSKAGGMDIEAVAEETPEHIRKATIDPILGLKDYVLNDIADMLGLPKEAKQDFFNTVKGLYNIYLSKDCNMIEINPLVLSESHEIICLDCKMDFDDNALYRHPDLLELRDIDEMDPKEVKASEYDLSYIALDGNIGCMVNGAGLAMATLDAISAAGGRPANFLDVGGSASEENITKAFEIIVSDPDVRGIFVNIFGGIMQCDVIAKGIIGATRSLDLHIPLVVRLEGSNEVEGKRLLDESGLNIKQVDNLDQGATVVVDLCGGQNEYMG